MGGSARGNFGKTKGANGGSVLDSISDFLTIASLIPVIDTVS